MSDESYVQIDVEASYGAGGAVWTGIICTSTDDPVDKSPLYEEPIHTKFKSKAYGGPLKLSGSIEGNLRPKMMMDLFECIFGNKAIADVDDYKFTVDDPKSMGLKVGEKLGVVSQESYYVGVGVSRVTLTCEAKEFVTVKADWFAKNVTKEAYVAPTYDVEDPVVFTGAVLKIGSAVVPSKSVELNIERSFLDDNFVIGSSTLHSLIENGHMSINGTIKFTEEQFDEINRAIYSTTALTAVPECNEVAEVQIDLEFTRACEAAVGATINIPTAAYINTGRRIQGRSETEKTVGFEVVGDTTSLTVVDGAL